LGDNIFKKIFILGAGAIGSSCGAILSKKNDVTLIANKPHADAVNANGLILKGDVSELVRIKADTKIREISKNSLIVLTTKVYDSEKALDGIKKLLKNDTVILILQNGIGNEEIVRRVVGKKVEVVRGVLHMGAEFLKPGEVRIIKGWITVGDSKIGRGIAELFNKSGLKTLIVDIKKDVWKKLTINCVINPLTAILEVRDYQIVVPELYNLRDGIVNECNRVAKAEMVEFEEGLRKAIDKEILGLGNYSSMHQDLMKGRRTEIDFLNGKIVEFGKKHNIPTPINETLVAIIKFLEEKNMKK
jgi:2-dehydropantoate 2-reductase